MPTAFFLNLFEKDSKLDPEKAEDYSLVGGGDQCPTREPKS